MWYFLIRQRSLETRQVQHLRKQASATDVEVFSEPYENWYVFTVERDQYPVFTDYLDREGIDYDLMPDRPVRADILAGMQ